MRRRLGERLDRLETAATTLKEQLQEGRAVDDAMPNLASSAPRGRLKTLDAHGKGLTRGLPPPGHLASAPEGGGRSGHEGQAPWA